MIAASDISDVPAEDVKNILIVIGFLVALGMNGVALIMGRRTQRREISGHVETSPTKEPADKSEVEDELESILRKIEEVKTSLNDSVREITAAGQKRADAISRKIDQEVAAIRQDVESRMSLVHEKVNSIAIQGARHGEAIEHLKGRDFQHDQTLAALQQRTTTPRKPG